MNEGNNNLNPAQPEQLMPNPGIDPNNIAQPAMDPVQPTAEPATPVESVQPPVEAAQPIAQPAVETAQPMAQPSFEPQTAQPMAAAPNPGIVTDPSAITTDFVAAGAPLPKKKGPIIAVVVVVLLAALGALGYFVIYPAINKSKEMKPAEVYESTIDNAAKLISNSVNEVIKKEKFLLDAELYIETDIPSFKGLSGYTYKATVGVDPKGKNMEFGGGIVGKDDAATANFYLVNAKDIYLKLSNSNLIYAGDAEEFETDFDEIFEGINESINTLSSFGAEDSQYLVDLVARLFKEAIPTDKIVPSEASFKVNGKDVKCTANKLVINQAMYDDMIKHVFEGVKNDKKAIEIFKKLGLSDEDIKGMFEFEEVEIDSNDNSTIEIVIYSRKSETLGLDLISESSKITYHKNDGDFEVIVSEEGQTVASIIGVKDGNYTNVSVKYGDTEIVSLVVKAWEENKVEFTYNVNGAVKGEFKYERKSTNNNDTYTFNVSAEITGMGNIKASLKIVEDWATDFPTVNTATAEQLNEDEVNAILDEFIEDLGSLPPISAINQLFTAYAGTLSGDYDLYGDDVYSYDYSGYDDYFDDYDYGV